MNCKICKRKTKKKIIVTRSKLKKNLYYCYNCDFEFFSHNPENELSFNKLNISRLQKAGLPIPTIKEDFRNGANQSKKYITKYVTKKDKKKFFLEIGCSFGYFLFLLKKKKFKNIYGVEINSFSRNYVKNKLNIECYSDINEIRKKKFDKIFMFYSLEYINKPLEYLKKIYENLLNTKGELIIITPNKNDILKDFIHSSNFKYFFYEVNSVNYFSTKSLKKILKNLSIKKYTLVSHQGYSVANLLHWFLNKKPIKSNFVGEDNFIINLIEEIKKNNYLNSNLSKELAIFFDKIKTTYQKILTKYNYGNQLILKIKK